jgi:RHS repeat-associated protein
MKMQLFSHTRAFAATLNLGCILLTVSLSQSLRGQSDDVLRLDVAHTNSNVVLTWPNAAAKLESSLTLVGPWIEVTNAVSPRVISASNLMNFFRLRATSTPTSFNSLYLAPTYSVSIGLPGSSCGCVSPENPNSSGGILGSGQESGFGNVLLNTGELTQHAVDLDIPGRGLDWRFERTYRSGMNYNGPLGNGWDFIQNRRLFIEADGSAKRMDGLGRADRYVVSGTNYVAPSGYFTKLAKNPNGSFTESDAHGMTWSYAPTNALGTAQMTNLADRFGNQMTFAYNSVGQLTNTIDTLQRSISYRYDSTGRLTNVTDFIGRTLTFAYDTNGDLITVTSPAVTGTPTGNDFPNGKTTRYTYSSGYPNPNLNHNLLTVTAPNEVAALGAPRLVAQYITDPANTNMDRLQSLTLGGVNASGVSSGGTIVYQYAILGAAASNDFTTAVFQNTVTNRNGNVTELLFNQLGSVVSKVQFTRGIRVGDPAAYTNLFIFNQDGLLIAQTNAELSSVQYTYDFANPNRLAQANLLQTISSPGPRGGDQGQIAVTKSYETNFNFLATSTDGRSNTMTIKYDARGNPTNIIHRLPSIVEDFAYNAFGQMTNHVLPDNGSGSRRRDMMVYYSSGPQAGYLQQRIIDSVGLRLTNSYAYDAAGNVTNSIDARGGNNIFIVNSLNQVVRTYSRAVSTPSGLVRYQRSSFYDANNNVVRTDTQNIDDDGNPVAAEPILSIIIVDDMLDMVVSMAQQVTTNHYVTTEYQYDPNGNRTLTRSGVATSGLQTNNTVGAFYDERDLVYQEVLALGDPDQSTTQLDYDSDGSLLRRSQGIESDPRITTYAYDGFDRQTVSTNAMGNVTFTHFDANGNPVSTRVDGELNDLPGGAANLRLAETTFTYDPMDRLVQTDRAFFDTASGNPIASGHATNRTIFSGTSQVLQTVDANNHSSLTSYDTANRRSLVTDAKTNTVAYAYDANGNVITTTEVDKSDLGTADQTFVTQNTYDGLDRLVQTVDNIGNTNRYGYDSRDNRLAFTDGRDNLTHYYYDGLRRLIATTRYLTDNGLGSGSVTGAIVTAQSWDDSSRLIGQTDANSNTTVYVYDSLNRMTQTVFADGTINTFVLDVHDNTLTNTDGNGNVVNATYDALDRVTAKTVTRGPGVVGTTFENYQYDGLSRIVRAEDDDSSVTRSYDSLAHVTTEIQQSPSGSAQTVARTYDAEGNLLTCTYPGGRVVNVTYDELDRKATISASAMSATYNYFGPKRVEERDYGNGTRAAFAYDGNRRVTNTVHTGTVVPFIDSRAYAWDAANNKTAANDMLAPTLDSRSFSYDSVGRLVQSVTANVGPTVAYALDGVGNRLSVTGGANAGNYSLSPAVPPADFQMNQYTTTPFDARAYDANGNLTNAGPSLFVYDYRDQLVAVTRYDGFGTYTNVLSAKYDCFGRRIESSVAGGVTRHYYADWQEIEEQSTGNSTIATFVWGKGIDELLSMDRLGQTYYYHSDDLGSIRKITLNSGNISEQYRYDDYGKPHFFDANGTEMPGSLLGNTTLFTGRRYDLETELYYDRSRHLEASTGRFITRDTVGIWGDLAALGNGYTYVGNNPYSFVDPFGTDGLFDGKSLRNAPPTLNFAQYRPRLPFTCKFSPGAGCDPVWNPTTHRWEGCETTFTYDSYCDCKKNGGVYLQAKPFWVWCKWFPVLGPAPIDPNAIPHIK